jgi:hypothetical protein
MFFVACIYFSKSPTQLSDCPFLDAALKMRAPTHPGCKERTMPNTAIAMNGLLDAEYFDFESTHVGDTFRIFVASPPFADKEKRYAAIYAADGNGAFPLVLRALHSREPCDHLERRRSLALGTSVRRSSQRLARNGILERRRARGRRCRSPLRIRDGGEQSDAAPAN